jgi:hypothetical protein
MPTSWAIDLHKTKDITQCVKLQAATAGDIGQPEKLAHLFIPADGQLPATILLYLSGIERSVAQEELSCPVSLQ